MAGIEGLRGQQKAVEMLARHIGNSTLKQTALEVAANKPQFLERELSTLNTLVDTLNNLCLANLKEDHPLLTETPKIAEIVNAADLDFPHAFSWKDDDEMKMRSATLIQTASIIDSEIDAEYHTNPDKILSDYSDEDLFRFYLLDFYARWWVTNNFVDREERNVDRDRKYSMILSNAMCEAAIIGAEAGNSDLANLTSWFLKMGWISENAILDKEWNTKFDPELIKRAHAVAGEQV